MSELERRLAASSARAFDVEAALAEFRRRADDARLLDVAYGEMDSPVGRLLVAVTPRGVARIAYEGEDDRQVLADLADQLSPRVLRAPERTDEARRELDAYFAGQRRAFDVPVDWSLIRGFSRKVLASFATAP